MSDFSLKALYEAIETQRQARGLTWQQAVLEINLGLDSASGRHPIALSSVKGLQTKAVAEGDGVLQMIRWLERTPENFVPGREHAEGHPLPNARPDQVLRFDTVSLHRALNAKRLSAGLSWGQVASEIGGTSATSLLHLKAGGRTGFPGVVRLTRWLGLPVSRFVRVTER